MRDSFLKKIIIFLFLVALVYYLIFVAVHRLSVQSVGATLGCSVWVSHCVVSLIVEHRLPALRLNSCGGQPEGLQATVVVAHRL